MPFRTLSTVTAAICLILAGVWFSLPEWILGHWHVVHPDGGELVSRRMACLFLALGVILFSVRGSGLPEVRRAIGNGIIAACLSLMALGLYDLAQHHAGEGILFAVGLESVICLAFLTVRRDSISAPAPEAPPAPAR